jgi:hypothetical protein
MKTATLSSFMTHMVVLPVRGPQECLQQCLAEPEVLTTSARRAQGWPAHFI